MAFILRKDWPPGRNWLPMYAEKMHGLKTYGCATAIEFSPDRTRAKRFENRQEVEQIAATFVVGDCRLSVEPE
jgi:hypothetical protein